MQYLMKKCKDCGSHAPALVSVGAIRKNNHGHFGFCPGCLKVYPVSPSKQAALDFWNEDN